MLFRSLLARHQVLSPEELDARYHVELEKYSTKLLIEAATLIKMSEGTVISASMDYQARMAGSIIAAKNAGLSGEAAKAQESVVNRISTALGNLINHLGSLKSSIAQAHELEEKAFDMAHFISETVVADMDAVREQADILEQSVDTALWKMPDYTDLLHSK